MSHGSYLVCGCGRWIFTNRLGGHPYCHCGRKWSFDPAKSIHIYIYSKNNPNHDHASLTRLGAGIHGTKQNMHHSWLSRSHNEWPTLANFASQQPMPEVQAVLAEHWDQLPAQSALVQIGVDSPDAAPTQDESDPKYITQQYKQAPGHLRALGQRKIHQDLKAKGLAEQLSHGRGCFQVLPSGAGQPDLGTTGSFNSTTPQGPQETMAKVGNLLAQATTTMDPDQSWKRALLRRVGVPRLQVG